MSNPFDDLKTDETETTEDAGESEEGTTEPESMPEEREEAVGSDSSVTETTVAETDDESEETAVTDASSGRAEPDDRDETPLSPAETGPAFEYSDVQQKPFYARAETVTEFENQIRTTIVPTLAEANVIDEETREIHDAVLRLANEQPERIAELVLEERRQSEST